MRSYFLKTFAIVFTSAIAFRIFLFGLSYPLNTRVRGDALEYLKIADGFPSFTSALNYVGGRTLGFPVFEYAIHQLLSVFSSPVFVLLWINAIGAAMLMLHIGAAWLFSTWAQRNRFIQSNITQYLLFFFLATFPALVGHTTTPITDTFSVDIIILGLIALDRSLHARNIYVCILASCISALLLGYSILVRPASLIALGIALFVCASLALWGSRYGRIAFGTALVGCVAVLSPSFLNCGEKYGSYCLQSPETFNADSSIQDGLRGARVMWTRSNEFPGTIPILADEVMINNYYRECHITAIFGIGDASLTGCLVARPVALPAFVVKKWIGLFDHFRFTPYLENLTPPWLRNLSRMYSALAWIGFSLCFVAILELQAENSQPNAPVQWINSLGAIFLASYSFVMLAQHTALHTEERYGFPLLPLCAAVVFMYGERSIVQYRTGGWRNLIGLLFFCSLTLALFLAQISAWDRLSFPATN